MNPYNEGRNARSCGRALLSNPHPRLSTMWADWRSGWMDEDELMMTSEPDFRTPEFRQWWAT